MSPLTTKFVNSPFLPYKIRSKVIMELSQRFRPPGQLKMPC